MFANPAANLASTVCLTNATPAANLHSVELFFFTIRDDGHNVPASATWPVIDDGETLCLDLKEFIYDTFQ